MTLKREDISSNPNRSQLNSTNQQTKDHAQAILIKVIPATSTKPTRLKAICARGSIVISADNLPGRTDDNHETAAQKLIEKFCKEDSENYGTKPENNPWARPRASGQLPSGDYCHVFLA